MLEWKLNRFDNMAKKTLSGLLGKRREAFRTYGGRDAEIPLPRMRSDVRLVLHGEPRPA